MFFPAISAQLKFGNITIPEAFDVNPWLFVLFTFLAIVFLLYLIEKLDLRRLDKIKGETRQPRERATFTTTETTPAAPK